MNKIIENIIFSLQGILGGRSLKITFLGLLFSLCFFSNLKGQTPDFKLPKGSPQLGGIAKSVPNQPDLSSLQATSKELEAYKGYLERIKSFKDQYLELRDQLDSLRENEVQDEIKDSLWTALKQNAQQQAEEQIKLMEDIKGELSSEFEEIQKSAENYKGFLEEKKGEIGDYASYEQMEFYLDNAEENLKAFTNEKLSMLGKDQLEAHLKKRAGEALPKEQLDVYGIGLDKLDMDAEGVKKQAKEKLTESGKKQISEQTGKLEELKGKLPNEVKDLEEIKAQKEGLKEKIKDFKLFGENELKGGKLKERLLIGAEANSLDAFGEGINGSVYFGYSFTHYLAGFAGPNLKKEWKADSNLSKKGHGAQIGLRFKSKGNWLGQLSIEHNYVNAKYPDIQSEMSSKGHKTYPLVGVGKEIELVKGLRSTFMGMFDPYYQANSRLHSGRFLLRVGVVYCK